MRYRSRAVWIERLLLVLIVSSLAGTLNLVLMMHRRAVILETTDTNQPSNPSLASSAPSSPIRDEKLTVPPIIPSPVKSSILPTPIPPPATPVEDPTIKVLAGMNRGLAAEIASANEADQRSAKLEMARKVGRRRIRAMEASGTSGEAADHLAVEACQGSRARRSRVGCGERRPGSRARHPQGRAQQGRSDARGIRSSPIRDQMAPGEGRSWWSASATSQSSSQAGRHSR